ncbi:MAG: right-handed parallel beta-helix repeat-containing protein [Acidobacteria bacterium]|nr:right-handed parallel beta-helix repeat-containing protein [Acidobacteriota bacterium]
MKRGFRLNRTLVGAALLLATASLAHAQEARMAVTTPADTVRVAAPTGERVTDRENVQAAFDAVQPGGTVVFAAGAYVVGGEGLVLRTPGVALRGDPDGTTLLGCSRKQRRSLPAGAFSEFSEACGDGFVLAAEAQRVSDLHFESFSLALSIREATESETQGRSASFTGGHVVEDNSFHDGFSFQIVLDADSTVRVRRNVFRNVWHAVAIGGRNIHVTENDISVPEPERVPFGYAGVAIGIRPLGEDGACSSMIVEDNRIDGHTEAVAIAVFPQDPGSVCSDIKVRDNEIFMRPVRMPDGGDQAGRLAIAPAIRLFNAQRLVAEGLMTWGEHWMPEGGWPDALSGGRISDVRVEANRITGAVGIGIEAAHVTDTRIVDNEIEVRPATTRRSRKGSPSAGMVDLAFGYCWVSWTR